jgi:hypothetical protein
MFDQAPRLRLTMLPLLLSLVVLLVQVGHLAAGTLQQHSSSVAHAVVKALPKPGNKFLAR